MIHTARNSGQKASSCQKQQPDFLAEKEAGREIGRLTARLMRSARPVRPSETCEAIPCEGYCKPFVTQLEIVSALPAVFRSCKRATSL